MNEYPNTATSFNRAPIVQKGKSLVAPEEILKDVSAARGIFQTFWVKHTPRVNLYAEIEGLIAGNTPYNPAVLAQNKLGHITNVNDLTALSIYERESLAYWNLLNETDQLANILLRGPQSAVKDWQSIMEGHFNDIVREWPSFNVEMDTNTAQVVKFGVSAIVWPDERDWRFRTVDLSRLFLEDQASTNTEQLTVIFVQTSFTVQYLFQVWEEFKDIKDSPWDIEALERVIMFKANGWVKNTNEAFVNMLQLQQRFESGDILYDSLFTDSVKVISCLMREYDGKFSHYLFDMNINLNKYLFKQPSQYRCLQDCIQIFTASPGEKVIFANKGVGHKIYAPCQMMMQLDCTTNDMAKLASTPFVQSGANTTRDAENLRVFPGVLTNIGSLELVQNNLGANIGQLIQLSQFQYAKLNNNLSNGGDNAAIPDQTQGSVSPDELKSRSYREFGINRHKMNHFYNQVDCVYRNMFVKLLMSKKGYPGYEYAEQFRRRCIEDGVPEDMLSVKDINYFGLPNQIKSVKAARVAGDGTTLGRMTGLMEMNPIVGSLPQRGQNAYVKEMAKAAVGKEAAQVFTDGLGSDEKSGGTTIAVLENFAIDQGNTPEAVADNDQKAHIVTHMLKGDELIQSLQQQQTTPLEAEPKFNALINHMQQHMSFIANNIFYKAFIEQIRKPWKQLYDYATFNSKNAATQYQAEIRKRQQAEADQQQTMNEQQLKQFVAQDNQRLKEQDQQAKIERNKETAETRGEIQRQQAVDKAANERLKTVLTAKAKLAPAATKQTSTPNQASDILSEVPTDDLRESLDKLNGNTPSPYDIE